MITAKEFMEEIKRIKNAFGEYGRIKYELNRYNRADTVNMSPNEMNTFAHIATSAYLVSRGYPEATVENLGNLKEIYDTVRKLSTSDSWLDQINNHTGREVGKRLRYKSQKEIFDYIFKNFIEPKRKK